tara:strand:- start:108 stop:287 length:180 start_codon:yes stop_codon:yes gene_type:complete
MNVKQSWADLDEDTKAFAKRVGILGVALYIALLILHDLFPYILVAGLVFWRSATLDRNK